MHGLLEQRSLDTASDGAALWGTCAQHSLLQANSCLMQEWLRMAGGHNKVEYRSGSHLKESSFRSIDLSLALALSLGRGLGTEQSCSLETLRLSLLLLL